MTAQILPVDIVSPGAKGLNLEDQGTIIDPLYATKAQNMYTNEKGTLAGRNGWVTATGTPITAAAPIKSMHEYLKADRTVELITAWDGGIGNDIDDPEGNDVSGAVTDTSGLWHFVNFNDKCIGFQAGQKLVIYTGTTFATVSESSGTAPTGGVGTAAFGRIYQSDSTGTVLTYSDLLLEAAWGSTGAGSIDLKNIWTDGQDTITGIVGFNGSLIVFGYRHVIFITDGTGSALGLNPADAYVSDVITGSGCVDQKSIQAIGEGELMYLSPNGVQLLGRLIQERSNPTATVSKLVRQELLIDYRAASAGDISSCYVHETGLYKLCFQGNSTWVFDTRRPYQDDDGSVLMPVYNWDLAPRCWLYREDGTVLIGTPGEVGTYTGYTDDGASITLNYESGWLDLGEELGNRLKILKRLGAIILTQLSGEITYKWAVDFNTTFNTNVKDLAEGGAGAEWNSGEWNSSEWAGSLAINIFKIPARDKGQYYKIGLLTSTDQSFAIQQLELFVKVGRLA